MCSSSTRPIGPAPPTPAAISKACSSSVQSRGWRPPIVCTTATTGDGLDELSAAIADHRAHLESDGRLQAKRDARLRDELRLIITQRLRSRADELLGAADRDRLETDVLARRLDPYTAADEVLRAAGA